MHSTRSPDCGGCNRIPLMPVYTGVGGKHKLSGRENWCKNPKSFHSYTRVKEAMLRAYGKCMKKGDTEKKRRFEFRLYLALVVALSTTGRLHKRGAVQKCCRTLNGWMEHDNKLLLKTKVESLLHSKFAQLGAVTN